MSFVGSSLARFFVFDPRLGPTEETEHEKILYYWPPATPLNRQQSDIGLTEALINFTRCSPSPTASSSHAPIEFNIDSDGLCCAF